MLLQPAAVPVVAAAAGVPVPPPRQPLAQVHSDPYEVTPLAAKLLWSSLTRISLHLCRSIVHTVFNSVCWSEYCRLIILRVRLPLTNLFYNSTPACLCGRSPCVRVVSGCSYPSAPAIRFPGPCWGCVLGHIVIGWVRNQYEVRNVWGCYGYALPACFLPCLSDVSLLNNSKEEMEKPQVIHVYCWRIPTPITRNEKLLYYVQVSPTVRLSSQFPRRPCTLEHKKLRELSHPWDQWRTSEGNQWQWQNESLIRPRVLKRLFM